MSVLDDIFLAYDVRGKVGSELNEEVLTGIGKAFADWLPLEGVIAIGYDMRPDSEQLAQALITGLTTQGRDVMNIGRVTSDMIYFAVGHFDLAGGAMITASHNPGEYNGIKFCRDQAKAVGIESGLLDIKKAVQDHSFKTVTTLGKVTAASVVDEWISHVLSFVDVDALEPLSVAVDAGNGMAGTIFSELEPFVPFAVTEMFFEPDGTFPNHIANPLEPKNLVDVQAMVKKKKCDAGLAFDGDGDRAVVIDEKGEPLSGTVVTGLLAEYFLSKHPGAVVLHNAICGRAAIEAIERAGGTAVRTKVGHSYIKAEMRVYKAIMAGEHSGHYYFADNYSADSGMIAAIIVLYLASIAHKPLSEIAKPLRSTYVQISETNFKVTDKAAILTKLKSFFSDGEQDELDGLSVNYPNYWFNVRGSNTEPLLRLNAEAKTATELDDIVSRVTKIIES